jgi:hypothetical protein
MRRRADSWMNATQILKSAPLFPPRRCQLVEGPLTVNVVIAGLPGSTSHSALVYSNVKYRKGHTKRCKGDMESTKVGALAPSNVVPPMSADTREKVLGYPWSAASLSASNMVSTISSNPYSTLSRRTIRHRLLLNTSWQHRTVQNERKLLHFLRLPLQALTSSLLSPADGYTEIPPTPIATPNFIGVPCNPRSDPSLQPLRTHRHPLKRLHRSATPRPLAQNTQSIFHITLANVNMVRTVSTHTDMLPAEAVRPVMLA